MVNEQFHTETPPLEPLPDWHMPIEAWRDQIQHRIDDTQARMDAERDRTRGWYDQEEAIRDRFRAQIAPYRDPETFRYRRGLTEAENTAIDTFEREFEKALAAHNEHVNDDMTQYGEPDDNWRAAYDRNERAQAQLNAASHDHPDMLTYFEDIGPSALDQYRTGEPTPANFRLPPTEHPPTNFAEAVSLLNSRPFIHSADVQPYRAMEQPQYPSIYVRGMPFPVDRIISADGFDAWSGRGSYHYANNYAEPVVVPDGKGHKALDQSRYKGIEQTSRGAITTYAQQPVDRTDVTDTIEVIRDAAGEYWGIAHGSNHRTAAAILRGQPELKATVVIRAPEDMVTLPFSVRERFAAPYTADGQ